MTSATPIIFGEKIWDPVKVLAKIGGVVVMPLCMLALSVATLTTNLAANVVSPANDFSNLAPSRISYRTGGMITAFLGALMMPWKIIETSHGYIFTWLIGYSALLGPIGGILVADYFLLRKKILAVDDLYRRGGVYEYTNGFNPAALVALVIGVAVNLPGFLLTSGLAGRDPVTPVALSPALAFFHGLYDYAWFVGFLLSGALYLALSRRPTSAGSRPS